MESAERISVSFEVDTSIAIKQKGWEEACLKYSYLYLISRTNL